MSVLESGLIDREMKPPVVVAQNTAGDPGIFCAAKGSCMARWRMRPPKNVAWAYLDIFGSNRLYYNIVVAACTAIKRSVAFERNSDEFETLWDRLACHCHVMGLPNFWGILLADSLILYDNLAIPICTEWSNHSLGLSSAPFRKQSKTKIGGLKLSCSSVQAIQPIEPA